MPGHNSGNGIKYMKSIIKVQSRRGCNRFQSRPHQAILKQKMSGSNCYYTRHMPKLMNQQKLKFIMLKMEMPFFW